MLEINSYILAENNNQFLTLTNNVFNYADSKSIDSLRQVTFFL